MPENYEIDTNALNFTLSQGNTYFVDFTPPAVKKYQGTIYEEVFPSIKSDSFKFTEDRYVRNTNANSRIERFSYYLK